MKVGVIGAGFGGLAAAYTLAKKGVEVTVFESGEKPGGLAIGFKEKSWKWSMEAHYHHWFTNDNSVLDLAHEIGHEVLTIRPKTSTYYDGKIYQVDSPATLLKFTPMPLLDRIRTGFALAYLKFTPYWKPLEKITAKRWILKYMGQKSWDTLWGPLFDGKFEKYADKIPASWFWTRINKRTMSLSYPKGGFQSFAEHLEKKCKKKGVEFKYKHKVESIHQRPVIARNKVTKQSLTGNLEVKTDHDVYLFDSVVCTLPIPLFTKVTKGLPEMYLKSVKNLSGIGAVNLVLSMKQQFLEDGTYWLNINDITIPFLAVVEHTNFMNKKNFNNEHLLYVGNYLETSHPFFQKSEKELVEIFTPYLKKINSNFTKSWIKKAYVFKAPFAQPIIPLNYSKYVPPFETPIAGLYLCNMQQVYPYDRGTNYAIELGNKVANLILSER